MATIKRGHNAQFFLDVIEQYDLYNPKYNNHKRVDLANRLATIHHIGDNHNVYTIFKDKHVVQEDIRTGKIVNNGTMHVDQLEGDDFEFANPILIYKCGYITMDIPENTNYNKYIKQIITDLHDYIDSNKGTNICGCVVYDHELVDEFSYYATNGIEVHIQSIAKFCKYNNNRKFFEMQPIPFIKDINNAFHVRMIDFAHQGTDEQQLQRCNETVKELLGYLNKVSKTNIKWVNMPIKKPLFSM